MVTEQPLRFLVVDVRSVRAFDPHPRSYPDVLAEIKSTYGGTIPKVLKQTDELVMHYEKRPKEEWPVIHEGSATIAIRSRGYQSFELEQGADYRVLLQSSGFDVRADGAFEPRGRVQGNYDVFLDGYGGAKYQSGIDRRWELGTKIVNITQDRRGKSAYFGAWIELTYRMIVDKPPEGASTVSVEDEATYERKWRSWKTVRKTKLP